MFNFSPSLWETARYRLKYCLKRPLNPKQPTNQPTFNFESTNRPMTLKVSMKHVWEYYQIRSNYDPGLTKFYAKVKFGHIGFCMGKSEKKKYFLETIAALGLKVARSI